jgi:hypothetical protein
MPDMFIDRIFKHFFLILINPCIYASIFDICYEIRHTYLHTQYALKLTCAFLDVKYKISYFAGRSSPCPMRLKHYSLHTERSYCDWIKQFVKFHCLTEKAGFVRGQ